MTKFIFALLLLLSTLANAAPVVTSISPTHGSFNGTNQIQIQGTGFSNSTAVDFDSTAAISFMVESDSLILATVPPGVPGTVNVIVTANSQNSAQTPADFYTYTQDSWRGILSETNPNGVTFFDTANNTVTNTIPLPTDSLVASISQDGKRIYTANSGIPGVSVIDAATNQIIATIPTTVGTGAFDMTINPAGTRLYISNNSSGYLTVIDTVALSVVTNVFIAPSLGTVSITPNGNTVYVGNFTFGTVTPFNTATNTPGAAIPTGFHPGMISITPDGTFAFVTNHFSDTVSVINIATNTVINTILLPPGSGPYGSSILPNGKTLYVANLTNSTITVIDVSLQSIVTTIVLPANTGPFWIASTPDSKTAYVANLNDTVIPIDVATNQAGAPFANTAADLENIIMSPDQAPVAAFVVDVAPFGNPSLFDATGSISPIGTISLYEWDFGDGMTLATNLPEVSHTYATPGTFIVTLKVTNSAGTSTSKVFSSRFMSNNGGPQAIIQHQITIDFLNPPIDLKGKRKKNIFLTQTDYYYALSWHPPTSGIAPLKYEIFKDAALTKLIGIVPAHKLHFKVHNRHPHKTYTYYIVSEYHTGEISSAVSIVVGPICGSE